MTEPMDDLRHTLDAMHDQGRVARFWVRDDDATVPSHALDRLIDITAEHDVPCLLAVIPASTGPALVRRLEAASHIAVAVHGWAHENHAPEGEKKCELGSHRPLAVVLDDLTNGLSTLQDLHGDRCLPVLVPPWNRIHAEVVQSLTNIGYRGLSVYGPEQPAPIAVLNTHVDLIDWRGTRGGRTDAALVGDLQKALDVGIPCVGLLTHHLVHDAQAWGFLTRLLALTTKHPACHWASARDIFHDREAMR